MQRSHFSIKNKVDFSFPNIVEIELELEPASQFGSGEEPCRNIRKGIATFSYDANTGRQYGISDSPLEPVRIFYEYDNWKIELQGNLLKGKSHCVSIDDLFRFVNHLHYLVPILFIEIAHPVFVKCTRGRLGGSIFVWELQKSNAYFVVGTQEFIENLITSALGNIHVLLKPENYRLASALNYYHVARRLIETGCTPFEFMAEVILNLAKVLQSLFGQNRDSVRKELRSLGYSDAEIETKFIVFMSLRDNFDVGHIMFAKLSRTQIDTLYAYLENAQIDFNKMFAKIFKLTSEGIYKLKAVSNFSLDRDKEKTLEKLIDNLPKLR